MDNNAIYFTINDTLLLNGPFGVKLKVEPNPNKCFKRISPCHHYGNVNMFESPEIQEHESKKEVYHLKNYTINATILLATLAMFGCSQGHNASEKTDADINTTAYSIEKFPAYTQKYPETTMFTQSHATGHVGDLFFTHWKDGGSASLNIETDGDFEVTWQGGAYNYVGGPGWHFGDKDRVIGYRFDKDSGANFITLYGWAYDKTMPKSDPAHLVEYYILQRWTAYEPSQNGVFGKKFTSNGVEYSTYRTIREQKPSINNTSTFYQYWSKPNQNLTLGQDREIIFSDHVKAWEDSGWILPNMDNFDASDDPTYQVMAVEVFNPASDGAASGRVWDATPK